jgi:hypothetical protein
VGVHVVLAEVHTFAANCQGDIHAVIDEEGDIVILACCVEFLGRGDESACVGGFVAVLNNSYACVMS